MDKGPDDGSEERRPLYVGDPQGLFKTYPVTNPSDGYTTESMVSTEPSGSLIDCDQTSIR